jgi:hypothetical protein
VSKIKHSAKSLFAECFILPRVFCVALGKELLCRVPEIKHSAKNMALGKEPNSGSDRTEIGQGALAITNRLLLRGFSCEFFGLLNRIVLYASASIHISIHSN